MKDTSSQGESTSSNLLFRMGRYKMLLIMLGGAVGTLARYQIGQWVKSQPWAGDFPYGTLVINVTGSFLLGALAVLFQEHLARYQDPWLFVLGIGFCGGYTTFSSFEYETYVLVRDRSYLLAVANVFGSVAAGFIGVLLGVMLVRAVFSRI